MKLGHIVFATTLCHFCCCVIRVVLGRLQCALFAAAVPVQHLCLATCFQRLLGMVPKWDGSQQTVRRLNPMPVNTQERMESINVPGHFNPVAAASYIQPSVVDLSSIMKSDDVSAFPNTS
jgi:hypothetical protein